jgi:hypothetical protein
MMLVELCAGSAAVTMKWLAARAEPPLPWLGGKRNYADAILVALGLAPSGGRAGAALLVEPGPWGEAYQVWSTEAGRAATRDLLDLWTPLDPSQLWHELRETPPPTGLIHRVAVWAVLQFWSYARKPVIAAGSGWRTAGFNSVEAYAADYGEQYVAPDGRTWVRKNRRLPELAQAITDLPDLSSVRVVVDYAGAVQPVPGSTVLIDPPYVGTTCGYGA